jgi:hypothetical protein
MRYTNMGYAIAQQTTPFGGPVPCAVSLPGQGKTAFERALSAASGREYVQMILRQMMPEDIKGVPAPEDILIGGAVYRGCRYLLGEDLLRAMHTPSIWHLDELNHAGDDVLGSAQEVINNPPPAAWVCASMNPVASSTAGRELPPAVVNRMCIVPWERPNCERRAGWVKGFTNYPSPAVPIVPLDFLDTCGKAWGQVMCDFEDDHMELFGDEAYPKDVNLACDPWPSDRSWTHVGILMAACDAVGAGNDVKAQLVQGCVGEAAMRQFMVHLMHRGLPDFEQLLAMPHTLKLDITRYDMSRAILTGVIGRVMSDKTPVRWEAACDVLEYAVDQSMETAATVYGGLMKIKPHDYMPKSRNGRWSTLEQLMLSDSHKV